MTGPRLSGPASLGVPVSVSHSPAPEARGLALLSALLLVYLVWGSTYLAIRVALEGGVPPLLGVSGLRFVAAGTAMFAFLRWRGMAASTRAQWANLLVMGALLLALGNGLVVLAEREVSSGLVAVAVAAMPLWMGLFAALRGQRPTRAEAAGLVLGFVGVAWLSAGGALAASPRGLVFLLVAAMAWAAG
ncbi:MAG: EamA family transporter, partial [Pseudoxanthomonas sp.]